MDEAAYAKDDINLSLRKHLKKLAAELKEMQLLGIECSGLNNMGCALLLYLPHCIFKAAIYVFIAGRWGGQSW